MGTGLWRVRGKSRKYLRYGYTDHGEPIELPDSPSMYPMVRIPGSRPQPGPATS